jgi:hypothetical protein
VRTFVLLQRRWLLSALLFAGTLCGVHPAHAQETTASLRGAVTDSTGARVPGATVTLTAVATGAKSTTTTDASGFYAFPQLSVGNYQLQVQMGGFEKFVQTGVELAVGQSGLANVALKIGSTSDEVRVSGNVPLVDTATATDNQLIGQQQAVELPLNGRDSQDLLNLAAGTVNMARYVSPVNGQGGLYPDEATYAVNGSFRDTVNYQMDGVDHNDTYLNTSLPFPNPDAIQEFALQSANFSAEYGNAAGGIVNIVTKSGSNQFHGSAFEFYRDAYFNAKNWFSHLPNQLHRNQFGGAVGGPIMRDKLFFFATYQGTKNRSSNSSVTTYVPTAQERMGDFTDLPTTGSCAVASLIDPVTKAKLTQTSTVDNRKFSASELDPSAQALLKYIPLPNPTAADGTCVTALHYQGLATVYDDEQTMGKLDYTRGRHQFSGHYFYSHLNEPAETSSANVLASQTTGNLLTVQTVSARHLFTKSPTLLFDTSFGWASQTGGSLSAAPFSLPSLGVKVAAPNPPEIALSVTNGFSISTNHFGIFNRDSWTYREDVTKILGRHELHIGGEALRLTTTSSTPIASPAVSRSTDPLPATVPRTSSPASSINSSRAADSSRTSSACSGRRSSRTTGAPPTGSPSMQVCAGIHGFPTTIARVAWIAGLQAPSRCAIPTHPPA